MATNPLSEVTPWDVVSEGYVSETMPIFELWAQDSFDRINIRPDFNVLDMATGPGTVAVKISSLVNSVLALDFSSQMIEQLKQRIAQAQISNITIEQCDCQKLFSDNNSFDLAFSQFGLMFFPNRQAGFNEMYRVLKPGGKGIVYSWAPMEQSPAMQMMIGALFAGFPEARPIDTGNKDIVKGLDDLDTFYMEMEQAGFTNVKIESITHTFPVQSVEQFWQSMVKGSAPITMMKKQKSKTEWIEKEKVSIRFLEENLTEKSLASTAYLAIGEKA